MPDVDRSAWTPIGFGLTPTDRGGLGRERAAALRAQLDALAAARARAVYESRTYPILGGARDGR